MRGVVAVEVVLTLGAGDVRGFVEMMSDRSPSPR
jgi:hypothetical protein